MGTSFTDSTTIHYVRAPLVLSYFCFRVSVSLKICYKVNMQAVRGTELQKIIHIFRGPEYLSKS